MHEHTGAHMAYVNGALRKAFIRVRDEELPSGSSTRAILCPVESRSYDTELCNASRVFFIQVKKCD